MNYYNEFDKGAAAWLRELIAMDAIPKGEVDERSITDVQPADLRGFTQCHFFAGIAGWSLALERAGIHATRPLWTGSCPCQDYSCAGKGKGMEGERDLWPDFFRLIRECRPERVFGEQVEDAIRHGWLDRLSADMEAEGYAVGAVVLGAHSAGADHIRQRIYWVADAEKRGGGASRRTGEHRTQRTDGACRSGESSRLEDAARVGRGGRDDGDTSGVRRTLQATGSGGIGGLVLPGEQRLQGHAGNVGDGDEPGRFGTLAAGPASETGCARRLGITAFNRPEMRAHVHGELRGQGLAEGRESRNFWSDAVAIPCRDNCFRRAEPGIFPLVAKLPRGVVPSCDPCLPGYANSTGEARVMRLKGYGNAINVETAAMFIRACEMELNYALLPDKIRS